MLKAEVEVDNQHGPIVRVMHDGISVAVYLADETGVVTTDSGQYGIEVSGAWREFKAATAVLAPNAKVRGCPPHETKKE